MKPAPFRYVRPSSVDEAISVLAAEGHGAKPLAGGQSLIPTMNFRLAQPAVLVDIDRLDELRGIREGGNDSLYIGAMTRHSEVERSAVVRERAPLLAEAMPWIAHPQIRNRGTVGGSLAHADPAAELPAVMLALDARVHLRGPTGDRTVQFCDFCTGFFSTALAPEELVTGVEIPALPGGTGTAFLEVSRRQGDFALVGVCAVVTLDAGGDMHPGVGHAAQRGGRSGVREYRRGLAARQGPDARRGARCRRGRGDARHRSTGRHSRLGRVPPSADAGAHDAGARDGGTEGSGRVMPRRVELWLKTR